MSKYNMRICKCGRIHMIDNGKIDHTLEGNKNLLLICAGCGNATVIGADIQPDYFDSTKISYNMYSFALSEYKDKTIDMSDFECTNRKAIDIIIYSHGYKVPMMSGMYATDYLSGSFSDRWYPDFYKVQRKDITIDEIMKFIDKYNSDRTTVNMTRFINETPEDIIEEISHYSIKSLNFKGTKWENEWNSR